MRLFQFSDISNGTLRKCKMSGMMMKQNSKKNLVLNMINLNFNAYQLNNKFWLVKACKQIIKVFVLFAIPTFRNRKIRRIN
jgi:hypothetical protein